MLGFHWLSDSKIFAEKDFWRKNGVSLLLLLLLLLRPESEKE